MGSRKKVDVSHLIEQLQCNDHLDYEELETEPKPPTKAMQQLEKRGVAAIRELESLALENLYSYSSLYTVEVLGRIKHPDAAASLLAIWANSEVASILWETVYHALVEQSSVALDAVLEYTRAVRQQGAWDRWDGAIQVLEHHQDPRIVDELLEGLQCPDENVREIIPSALAGQGDTRVVPHLILMLDEKDLQDEAKTAIRRLLPPEEYRAIFEKAEILGSTRYAEFASKLKQISWNAEWIFEASKWEGDDAEILNAALRDLKKLDLYSDYLYLLKELLEDEGLVKEAQALENVVKRIFKTRQRIERKHQDFEFAIDLSLHRQPFLIKEPTKFTYKGLARSSYDPNPHLETLNYELKKWLSKKGFRINCESPTDNYHRLFARRGAGKRLQVCLVDLRKAESRRHLGQVTLNLAGPGWDEEISNTFETNFWTQTTALVQSILRQKVEPELLEE